MPRTQTARPTPTKDSVRVRRAAATDAHGIAALSKELGYPLPVSTARERLVLLRGTEHEIAVAVHPRQGVVGWVEVRVEESLTSGRRCRVLGLVVASDARRGGIGGTLLGWSEGWARSRGCAELYVTSNAARKEAHAFYPARGWRLHKTSRVYVRSTGRSRPGRMGADRP